MTLHMKRVVFIVEGDTEIFFIEKCIIPYLYNKGVTNPMNAQKIITNRKLNKKGGNVNFEFLKNDIKRVAATKDVLITTLLDFFRLPTNFPGYTENSLKISQIENAIREEMSEYVDTGCLLPYIQRHEIESLMFSGLDGFDIVIDDCNIIREINSIMKEYPNPEDINTHPDKAPSKRLERLFPYDKTFDGEIILEALSVDNIRDKCPRFNNWMDKLETGIREGRFG